MKLNLLTNTSILAVMAVIISACGGGSGESASTASSEGDDFDAAKNQIISDIDNVISTLPPPSEVPYLLMATGSDFDASLINGLEKVDSYLNPQSKAALNLGVFLTDVGYLTSYEKAQQSLAYITACQKLAEAIGVASAMDLQLMSRFERNLGSKDSLKVLVDEIILRANDRLDAMDRMNVAGLVLVGTYIEGLAVSTKLIQTYPNELPEDVRNLILEPLIKIVIDQKPALDGLLVVMNSLDKDDAITSMITDLTKLKEIYEGELSEISMQIADNTGSLVLETAVLDNLATEVQRIRASIIK